MLSRAGWLENKLHPKLGFSYSRLVTIQKEDSAKSVIKHSKLADKEKECELRKIL